MLTKEPALVSTKNWILKKYKQICPIGSWSYTIHASQNNLQSLIITFLDPDLHGLGIRSALI